MSTRREEDGEQVTDVPQRMEGGGWEKTTKLCPRSPLLTQTLSVMETVHVWWSRLALEDFKTALRTRRIDQGVLLRILDTFDGGETDEWEFDEVEEVPRSKSWIRGRNRRRKLKKRKRKGGRFPGTRDDAEAFLEVEVVGGEEGEEVEVDDAIGEALGGLFLETEVGGRRAERERVREEEAEKM